jgi:hypothetical protein
VSVVAPVGDEPSDVAIADYDGDGLGDMIVTNAGDDTVTILVNDGAGGFVAEELPVGNRPGEADPEDLDNDKDIDNLVRNAESGDVTVMLNDGSGGFDLVPLPVGIEPGSLAIRDLDLDGDADFLVVTETGTTTGGDVDRVIRAFRNELNETGELGFRLVNELAPDPRLRFVASDLLSPDGWPDVAKIDVDGLGGASSGAVSVLLSEPGCAGDFDGSGAVDMDDLKTLLAAWGVCPDPCPPRCPSDLDGDCVVRYEDLLRLLAEWGECP